MARHRRVATLKSFERLKKTNNTHDSAIAVVAKDLLEKDLVNFTYPEVNKLVAGFRNARQGENVQKFGRTTEYTTGRILALHSDLTIGYDAGDMEFKDCIVTTNISQGGDSGSLVLNMDFEAVGLLFAGSSQVTIANPIHYVIEKYGLKLWEHPGTIPDDSLMLDGKLWARHPGNGKLEIANNRMTLTSRANHTCFIQHPLGRKFKMISCAIHTGTERGATWGPGITVKWPNGFVKVNLRPRTYGAYHNHRYNVRFGDVRPNTIYALRIRDIGRSIVCEAKRSRQKWVRIMEIARGMFRGHPTLVRIGKTSSTGNANDFRRAGPEGSCWIGGIKVR